MPTLLNTAGGLTDGTTVTTANSGGTSGDAWNTVTVGTGNTHRASNERAAHGTICYEMNYLSTGGAHRLMWSFSEAGRAVITARYFIEDVPTAFEDFGGIRHASGNMCVLSMGTDGKFILANAIGTGISASRATNAVPTGQWITVQVECTKGTTTTNGMMGYRYFLGIEPTGTPVFEWSDSAQNTGTANISQVWFGRSTTRTQARIVWYDTLQAHSLASGWPAAYQATNQLPTVELLGEAFGLEPGAIQNLAVIANDPDGTIASYSVVQVSGSPSVTIQGTGANRTYMVPPTLTGTILEFEATVVDNDGGSVTSAPIEHHVLPAAFLISVGGVWVPAVLRTSVGGEWV